MNVTEELLSLSELRRIQNEKLLLLKESLSLFENRGDLFSVNNLYSPQMFAKYPEALVKTKLEGHSNIKNKRTGDFYCAKYGNVEYKYSIAKHSYGRFLQIRPLHDIDFYIFDIYFENTKKLFTFLLSKNQVTQELKKNYQLTHGINDKKVKNIDVECTIDMNKERFESWCRIYKIEL